LTKPGPVFSPEATGTPQGLGLLIQPGTDTQHGQIVIDKRLTFASLYESTQQEHDINQTIIDGNNVDQRFFQNTGTGME